MKISNLRQSGAGSHLARFDIEMSPQLKLLDWTLKRNAAGQLRAFPPSPRQGTPAAWVDPVLAAEIVTLAANFLKGGDRPHDRNQ